MQISGAKVGKTPPATTGMLFLFLYSSISSKTFILAWASSFPKCWNLLINKLLTSPSKKIWLSPSSEADRPVSAVELLIVLTNSEKSLP